MSNIERSFLSVNLPIDDTASNYVEVSIFVRAPQGYTVDQDKLNAAIQTAANDAAANAVTKAASGDTTDTQTVTDKVPQTAGQVTGTGVDPVDAVTPPTTPTTDATSGTS